VRTIALLTLALALVGAASAAVPSPPAGKLYHGVYPGGITGEEDDIAPADLSSYQATVHKTAAWVYFSDNWYRSRSFPLATATWIRDAGSVPFIRLMLLDSAARKPNKRFTLAHVLRGDFDADFHTWGRAAQAFGTPLIVEFGTEVNGSWFPWNGKWNGGKKGPSRFREAYRHIVDLILGEGATNVTWVFHVNGDDDPARPWNRFENYYPGDAYVDWVAVSAYGAQEPTEDWCGSFRDSMDAAYPRLVAMAPSKPLIVAEFGVTSRNRLCDQADWASAALSDLISLRWPKVIGFSWWNEQWENDNRPAHDTDMRVQDNPRLADAFRTLVGAKANVLGRVGH